jgi:hypothetical protein
VEWAIVSFPEEKLEVSTPIARDDAMEVIKDKLEYIWLVVMRVN